MRKIGVLLILCLASNIYAQEKGRKERVSIKLDVEDATMLNKENAIDLQEYIESVYLSSTKFFNQGALPLVEKGEYAVVLVDSEGNNELKKSSDFKGIAVDKIESFEYKKVLGKDFINGTFATSFGIISIKIKS
ncbi:hypothetical protein [Myroides odoratimimus]|uniref:hypothetical protein n=1 Tax=Myroides odoratimimus TaxID=76832 RepID=UPI0031017E1E